MRAAASLCFHLARRGGCAILIGDRGTPSLVEPRLRVWADVHARLALVKAGDSAAPARGRHADGSRPSGSPPPRMPPRPAPRPGGCPGPTSSRRLPVARRPGGVHRGGLQRAARQGRGTDGRGVNADAQARRGGPRGDRRARRLLRLPLGEPGRRSARRQGRVAVAIAGALGAALLHLGARGGSTRATAGWPPWASPLVALVAGVLAAGLDSQPAAARATGTSCGAGVSDGISGLGGATYPYDEGGEWPLPAPDSRRAG